MPRKASSKIPTELEYTIRDVEQLKVLADPLRIRILEALTRERTTKQIAEELGEKPTKLYHHVEALEKVGLIRLSRTRRNRGTLEKYFLAIARTFRADSKIFATASPLGEEGEALRSMLSVIFDGTASELRRVIDHAGGQHAVEEKGIVSYLELQGDEKTMEGYRRRLTRLVRDIQKTNTGAETSENDVRYRLTLAFYPLEPPKADD